MCGQALMALADTAMVFACSAAWNGYKPMSTIDQTTHFLRPVNFDVLADARIVRIGRTTSFGRVMLTAAADGRPVGMVSSAYAMLWYSHPRSDRRIPEWPPANRIHFAGNCCYGAGTRGVRP